MPWGGYLRRTSWSSWTWMEGTSQGDPTLTIWTSLHAFLRWNPMIRPSLVKCGNNGDCAPENIKVVLRKRLGGGNSSGDIRPYELNKFSCVSFVIPWFDLHRSDLARNDGVCAYLFVAGVVYIYGQWCGLYWLNHTIRVGTIHDENSWSIRPPRVGSDHVSWHA